ncbi:putative divalent heavy-metal cations transporter [Aequorivita sublithincola DSM 14238]|uniref:Putative divalent heavy-metal cations transporter n=1 Tax=Aequorivita sublithincola (strain DSM 14238 / LMG 21431 / ACAM 643 / 9-3) TaxID=746697 RepID=I3YZ84_AEQSU|nr:ZIP family metal transporter [Aequorivita sublithincola]AFL82302.1 putative divalent heavy-metal cations transporter [Aequorivita sublithincola DSM 14238]
MNYLLLFLAVAVGYFVAVFLKQKELRNMEVFLAFSGAFLLSITVFELIPHVFETPSKSIGVYIMLGILLQIFLEFFSKGAEHGHVHLHSEAKHFPWILFVSLSIHAFMEGFPISEENNLLLAIIIHKIPVAIILSFFFITAGYKKSTTLFFLFFFALMTPLGSFIANNYNFVHQYETQITAVVIGIFLHVSTTILFESSKNHKFNLSKMTAVILAVVIAYFI